jgi:hypothetical protein
MRCTKVTTNGYCSPVLIKIRHTPLSETCLVTVHRFRVQRSGLRVKG